MNFRSVFWIFIFAISVCANPKYHALSLLRFLWYPYLVKAEINTTSGYSIEVRTIEIIWGDSVPKAFSILVAPREGDEGHDYILDNQVNLLKELDIDDTSLVQKEVFIFFIRDSIYNITSIGGIFKTGNGNVDFGNYRIDQEFNKVPESTFVSGMKLYHEGKSSVDWSKCKFCEYLNEKKVRTEKNINAPNASHNWWFAVQISITLLITLVFLEFWK